MGKMQQSMGVWLPAHERHMSEWMSKRMHAHPEEIVNGKGTYQYHKLLAAMKWVKNFRVAIDVGAHVGLWSMHLVKRFLYVEAFEPIELHRQCFEKNVEHPERYRLNPFALGETSALVDIRTTEGSSGDTKVVVGEGSFPLQRLDDVLEEGGLAYTSTDFLKVDAEGYELFILRGGAELLERCKPCVIVEQKHNFASSRYGVSNTAAVSFLTSMGAKLRKEIGGDYILSWDESEKLDFTQPEETRDA